jgi:short subunit dehydrogenase-like uncharacterized protein
MDSMTKKWMIYGATGYSGKLIAKAAAERGMTPVIAGRSAEKTRTLGEALNLPHAAFSLDDPAAVAAAIEGCVLVLHCAGPFSATSAPMVEACLRSGAHYLDITGEIEVFEAVHARDEDARKAGVVLCPGVGFDVIPTDCVAAALVEALPGASHLALGFDSRSSLSPGTAKTSLEGLADGGKVRRDGKIVTVPLGYKAREIDFGKGPKNAVTIPWGDVSTAWHTTGIPNIEVYMAVPPATVKRLRRMRLVRPFLKLPFVLRFAQGRIEKKVKGPSEERRKKTPTFVWGEARDTEGNIKTARIKTANGYEVTVTGSLAIAAHLLENSPEGGAYTPARLMGKDLAASLPDCGPLTVE